MGEVKRYRFISSKGYAAIPVVDSVKAERYVEEQDFDRVTAENSSLQALLTAADERADVLEGLLQKVRMVLQDEGLLLEIIAALKPAEVSGSTCNQVREETGLPINRPCKACNGGACIDR